ncbi:RNA polymerase sigma factor [uncultured Ruthenibacterium sp.]|uniref:RNA polymerase sigma factor n=1 Tax=uncultured Ruthenibacterium sp. TaxID=1905347 RepID=UPI00349E8EA6
MNNEQFTQMVQQYERLVYTICYQFTKDHQLAQDLAQETFLAAYSHRNDCPADNYKPWLARIAANKAKDYLKSAYHRRVQATEDDAMGTMALPPGSGPEDVTIAKDSALRIEQEIRALKEPYHMVSVLFFLEENSIDEIAQKLNRPPKTVHTQLYRAKQMLKNSLERGMS